MKTGCRFWLGCSVVAAWIGGLDAADWPQWRGPLRTAVVPDAPLLTNLPSELPVVWNISIGPGHASPVVASRRLVYLDAQNGEEVAHCLDAQTGKELWKKSYATTAQDEFGEGPRSTPFIDGDRVYVQSMRGDFHCLQMANGEKKWGIKFDDFGVQFVGSKGGDGTAARRGNNGSGLVHGDKVMVPVGATNGASIVAFDKMTGALKWKSLNDEAAYSSMVVASPGGREHLIAFTADALCGLDLASGKLLWRVPLKSDAKRHAVTPLVDGNRVIISSHSLGLVAIEITRDNDQWAAQENWRQKNHRISIASMVRLDGHLYGQGADRNFICLEAADGTLRWSQAGFGEKPLVAYSSTLVLGKNLLVLTEGGELLLVAGNPEKYQELGRLQVCGSTWAFPAVTDGRIYLRDKKGELTCRQLGR